MTIWICWDEPNVIIERRHVGTMQEHYVEVGREVIVKSARWSEAESQDEILAANRYVIAELAKPDPFDNLRVVVGPKPGPR
jgi:hypothetical protein